MREFRREHGAPRRPPGPARLGICCPGRFRKDAEGASGRESQEARSEETHPEDQARRRPDSQRLRDARFAKAVARTKCRLRPNQPRVSTRFRQIVPRPLTGFTRRAEWSYVDFGNTAKGLAAIRVAVRRHVIARQRHRLPLGFPMPGGEEGDHRIEIVAVDGARAPGSHSGHMGTAAITYISGRSQPGSLSEKWLPERLGRLPGWAARPGWSASICIERPGGAS